MAVPWSTKDEIAGFAIHLTMGCSFHSITLGGEKYPSDEGPLVCG